MMFKNIAATLQTIERDQRRERRGERAADPGVSPPAAIKLGPLQKIIAFGPLVQR